VGAVARGNVETGLVGEPFPSLSVMTVGGVDQCPANASIAVYLRDLALHRIILPEIVEIGRSPESNH
jgi:hypothetical protein